MSGHDRERELFERLSGLGARERAALIERECGGDAALRARVEALLAAHDQAGAFLENPTVEPNPGTPTVARGATLTGTSASGLPPGLIRIAGFTLIRRIGEGGMGAVFLAKQDKPEREVALKVVKSGFASATLRRRFELEAEVLGRLQHPGIAQVFEAGMYDTGDGAGPRPYFAMEYIRGEPLDKYIDRHRLGTRDRLTLAAKICDAVQHAHQKGIIHRDLKPGNILVTDEGEPKVLDFGIARATDSDIQTSTLRTDVGQLIGTVPYMSPEQVTGDPHELDTRSDVYALGVVIYELLAGKLPYDLEKKLIHEAVRVIREDEPTRLSNVSKVFRGDIETIVAKALEKDKTRRYQSANALAMDIRHYLSDEPIAARPASTWYQFRKFSRRNRGLVAGVAAAFILLVAGIAGTSVGLFQANAALKRESEALGAESKSRRSAQGIADFVVKSLQTGDAKFGGKEDTTIVQAMQTSLKEIDAGALKHDPDLEASLIGIIAQILGHNGHEAEAEPLSQRSLDAFLKLRTGDDADVATALNSLATTQQALGRIEKAEPNARRALDMSLRVHKGDHESTAACLNNLAAVMQSLRRPAEAADYYQQAAAMLQRLYPGDHWMVASALLNVAQVKQVLGKPEEAEPLLEQALEMNRRLSPGDHPGLAHALNVVGNARLQSGRPDLAEPLYGQALDMYQRVYKGDHPMVAYSMEGLGTARAALGRFGEAATQYRKCLDMRERLFPGDNGDVANSMLNLGDALRNLGRVQESEDLLRKALRMLKRLHEGDDRRVALCLNKLAAVVSDLGQPVKAESLYQESLDMMLRLSREDDTDVAGCMSALAQVKYTLGRYDQAEPLARRSLDVYERVLKGDRLELTNALGTMTMCLIAVGRAKDAEPVARRCLDMRRRLLKGDHADISMSLDYVGATLQGQGRAAEALPFAEEALDMNRRLYPMDHPHLAQSLGNVAAIRLSLGNYAEAEPLHLQALDMRRNVYGGDHPRVIITLNNLASCQLKLGKSADAETHAREAIEMCDRVYSREHPHKAEAISLLAGARFDQGDRVQARDLILQAEELILKFTTDGATAERIAVAKKRILEN